MPSICVYLYIPLSCVGNEIRRYWRYVNWDPFQNGQMIILGTAPDARVGSEFEGLAQLVKCKSPSPFKYLSLMCKISDQVLLQKCRTPSMLDRSHAIPKLKTFLVEARTVVNN